MDDKSHQWESSRRRDAFKDAALGATGVPILRVKAAGDYGVKWLREEMAKACGG